MMYPILILAVIAVQNVLATGPPVIGNGGKTNMVETAGINVKLPCSVNSDSPIVTVYWTVVRNGGVSQNINIAEQQYEGSSIGNPSLTIVNVDTEDSGHYTCHATNAEGPGSGNPIILHVGSSS